MTQKTKAHIETRFQQIKNIHKRIDIANDESATNTIQNHKQWVHILWLYRIIALLAGGVGLQIWLG